MIRVTLDPVFILHKYPYLNSSYVIELFSLHHGRVSAVARSARGPKSRYKGCLQSFSPLLVSWSGRSELMNLGQLELDGMPYQLQGNALISAFYLNELLLRLLPRADPYSALFNDYKTALTNLQQDQNLQITLRCFEKNLLSYLGYGLSLSHDVEGQAIFPDDWYQWLPEQGFVRSQFTTYSPLDFFSGQTLLAFLEQRFDSPQVLLDIKRLMKKILHHYLGEKPLKSRELLG